MMWRVGLIGNPIRHSLSPAFQKAAIAHLRLNATYELWEVSAEELTGLVQWLRRDPSCLGANVTIPFKEACMPLVDALTPRAERVGALNTIYKSGTKLVGDNTDLYGVQVTLTAYLGLDRLENAVVLGAGGAAKAVVDVVVGMGCQRLYVVNRNLARGQSLVDKLKSTVKASVHPWEGLPDLLRRGPVQLLVNATPLGRKGERVLMPEMFSAIGAVFDLVYFDTPLVAEARSLGVPAVNGLPMLVHQGAKSFELWFGRSAPVEVMMEAAQRAVRDFPA